MKPAAPNEAVRDPMHEALDEALDDAMDGALDDALGTAASCNAALWAIYRALVSVIGHNLLTVNLDVTQPDDPPGEVQLQRLWTSDPGAYPVGGRKRKTLTPWTRQLLQRGEVFIGEGDAALAAVFDEHQSIAELGLHAVVNVPLLQGERCVATFNVLGTRLKWQAHEVAAIGQLAQRAKPWVLQARAEQAAAAGR